MHYLQTGGEFCAFFPGHQASVVNSVNVIKSLYQKQKQKQTQR